MPTKPRVDNAAQLESTPGFKTPTDPFRPPASSPPESPDLSTTSPSPPSPPPSDPPAPPITSSSPGSSEPDRPAPVDLDHDTTEALEAMATGVAHLGGLALNRMADRNKSIKTNRWKMTEDEAAAIGGAVTSMATRRLPAAVTEGDGPEVLQIASVLVSYGIRNALNLSPAELAQAAQDFAAGGPAEPPAPPPPAPSPFPTAPPPRTWAQAPAPPPAPPQPPAPAPPIPQGVDGVAPAASQASDVIEQLAGLDS